VAAPFLVEGRLNLVAKEGAVMSESASPARVSVRLSRFVRPENVCPALLLLWGTVFALLMPPMLTPDESGHAYRSFHLSRGRLQPDGIQDGWCCGRCPELLNHLIVDQMATFFRPERRLQASSFRPYTLEPLEGLPEQTVSFGILSYSCPVPYLPQAAGIFVARKLGGSLLTAVYAGRLGNLVVCVLALAVALRLLPCYRNLLGAVALLPVAVQQTASLSADALGMAAGFLFTALMLRILASTDRRPGLALLLPLWAVGAVLPMCKLPYALLTLLYLGVRPSRLGSWRRYLVVGIILVGATGLGAVVTMRASQGATKMGEGQPAPGISQSAQRTWMLHHPGQFAATMAHTLAAEGWNYWGHLSILGLFHLAVNPLAANGYLLLLFFLALLDRRDGWSPGLRFRLTAFAVGSLGLVLVHVMLYLVWTPVANPVVYGFQGRYFLVFLPASLLLLSTPAVSVKVGGQVLLALTAAGSAAVHLAAVVAILARHYLPSGFGDRYTPAVLGGGAVLCIAALLGTEMYGRRKKGESEKQAFERKEKDPPQARELPLAG
jgi:uncharacterized membrane protein